MTPRPRAEFRVFGHGIIAIVESNMWNGRTVLQQMRAMPAETYVLSAVSAVANVKMRGGVLDIKTRIGDTREGYQIFQPMAKYPFPLGSEQLATLTTLLGATPFVSPQSAMAEDEFLRQVAAHQDLRLVTVAKQRFGFTIGGAICEYARVFFNGALVESACVESEEYESMAAIVSDVGLSAFENINYIEMASRVIGLRHAGA